VKLSEPRSGLKASALWPPRYQAVDYRCRGIQSSVALEARALPQEALAEIEREPEVTFRLQGQALAYHALGRKKEADAVLVEYVAKYHAEGAFQIAEV